MQTILKLADTGNLLVGLHGSFLYYFIPHFSFKNTTESQLLLVANMCVLSMVASLS